MRGLHRQVTEYQWRSDYKCYVSLSRRTLGKERNTSPIFLYWPSTSCGEVMGEYKDDRLELGEINGLVPPLLLGQIPQTG